MAMVGGRKYNVCHKLRILSPFGRQNRNCFAIIPVCTVAPNVHTYVSPHPRDARVIFALVRKVSCCLRIDKTVALCPPVDQITSPARRLSRVMAPAVIRIRIAYRPRGAVMARAIVLTNQMKLAVPHVDRICSVASRVNVSIKI